jgi:hypothetical protein
MQFLGFTVALGEVSLSSGIWRYITRYLFPEVLPSGCNVREDISRILRLLTINPMRCLDKVSNKHQAVPSHTPENEHLKLSVVWNC